MTFGPVEGINQGENRGTRSETRNAVASKSQFAAHHLKSNFGAWMLVSRKERRGRGRGGVRPTAGYQSTRTDPRTPRFPQGGVQTHSRYAALEGLEGEDFNPTQEGPQDDTTAPIINESLPRIRTNYQQNQPRQYYRSNDYQFANIPPNQQSHYVPPHRGGQKSRGGRGEGPRQAAAESEHTVVRGYNRGRRVVTTVVDDDLCVVISDGNGEVSSVQSTFMQKANSGASFPATRAGFPTPLPMTTSDRKRGTTDNGAAFR
nr:uncharacterized protein LOC109150807 [Ipomoea batatas]